MIPVSLLLFFSADEDIWLVPLVLTNDSSLKVHGF